MGALLSSCAGQADQIVKMKFDRSIYFSIPFRQPRTIYGPAKWRMFLLVITTIFASGITSVYAQTPTPVQPEKTETAGKKTEPAQTAVEAEKNKDTKDDPAKPEKEKRGSWILAPIPIKSPAFGAGLVLAAGYVFKLNPKDEISPPSTIGAAFAFTNNGSRGLVIGGRLYFAENKYQTAFAAGKGRANYEYFGIGRIVGESGVSVLMKQNGGFVFGEFMRNFGKNVFIGPRYQYRRLSARLDERETQGGFEIPAIDVESTTTAIGFHVQRDQRDSVFYPTKGSLFDFKGDFFAKAIGSNRTYQTYSVSYNGYRKIGKGQVLAYRGMGCSVRSGSREFRESSKFLVPSSE